MLNRAVSAGEEGKTWKISLKEERWGERSGGFCWEREGGWDWIGSRAF